MAELKIFSKENAEQLTDARRGEIKLGERIRFTEGPDELSVSQASFVLMGLPEDVGVKANLGVLGTASAWQHALSSILNIQSSSKLDGTDLIVLGHIDFSEETIEAANLNARNHSELKRLREIVSEIDLAVFDVLKKIFDAGKVPIIIGGGHNNCYPIIKAFSESRKQAVNVINLDAHADFRELEGRHSGNGFRYAFEEGYLNKYAVLGLHENYNSKEMMDKISQYKERISAIFFDDLIRESSDFKLEIQTAMSFANGACGLEIDMDSISGMLSSASSESGFQLNQVREMIAVTRSKKFSYLHICEGASVLSDGRRDMLCGKNIAYLVSDFIKAQNHQI